MLYLPYEIWRDVAWYYGYYKISNMGRVMDIMKWSIRNISRSKRWYETVVFRVMGKYENFLVHRLVWTAFLDNSHNKPSINHINWIKYDNRACNLEWCTQSENNIHKYRVLWYKATDKQRENCRILSQSSRKKVTQSMRDWSFIKDWDYWSLAAVELWITKQDISACCLWRIKTAWWFKRSFTETKSE